MSRHEDVKGVARRWFEEAWNARRDDAVEELMSVDSIGHVEGGEVRGREAFRRNRELLLSALPDVRIEVEDVIAEADRAAVRWRAVGTHGGDGFGFRASKAPVDVRGTTWLTIRDGQIVEGWDTWNLGGLLDSLRTAAAAQ